MIASFGRRVGEPEAPETGFEETTGAVLEEDFWTISAAIHYVQLVSHDDPCGDSDNVKRPWRLMFNC